MKHPKDIYINIENNPLDCLCVKCRKSITDLIEENKKLKAKIKEQQEFYCGLCTCKKCETDINYN